MTEANELTASQIREFLIHRFAEVYLTAEITGVGVNTTIVPDKQFLSWEDAKAYFKSMGATDLALEVAKRSLDEIGHAHLGLQSCTPFE